MTKKPEPLTVRLGLIDRVVARLNPQAGARRFAARVALAQLSRAYDGASKGRGTDGWSVGAKSGDAEILPAAGILRDRMRDLIRNNATAAQAIEVLVTSMVGSGIRPRAKTGNAAKDKKIDALFEQWSKSCDADGHTDFYGIQALAVRLMLEGGDAIALQRPRRRSDALPVPVQVQVLEADHIDTYKNQTLAGGGIIRAGIEFDALGRRKAFYLFKDHPGDQNPILNRSPISDRVDAQRVAHLFERQRTQSRGVPWGTPALRALRDIDDWIAAELTRKKIEACMVGIVFGADEENQSIAPKVEDADGNPVEQFEPGLIAYARGGKDIKFNQPGNSAGIYEWNSVMDHRVAAGFRVPYELITGDLRQVNFSSARVGLQAFGRMIEKFQWTCIIPAFCAPVWEWFCAAAYADGKIDAPTIPVEWAPPRLPSVNPLQDAQTDLTEVRAGFASPQQAIAKRGYDPAVVMAEWVAWSKMVDKDGMVFDSDARRVTKGGQGQGPVAYDPDTGEPISTIDAKDAGPAASVPPEPAPKEGEQP